MTLPYFDTSWLYKSLRLKTLTLKSKNICRQILSLSVTFTEHNISSFLLVHNTLHKFQMTSSRRRCTVGAIHKQYIAKPNLKGNATPNSFTIMSYVRHVTQRKFWRTFSSVLAHPTVSFGKQQCENSGALCFPFRHVIIFKF